MNLEAIATIQSHRIRKQQAAIPRFSRGNRLTAFFFTLFTKVRTVGLSVKTQRLHKWRALQECGTGPRAPPGPSRFHRLHLYLHFQFHVCSFSSFHSVHVCIFFFLGGGELFLIKSTLFASCVIRFGNHTNHTNHINRSNGLEFRCLQTLQIAIGTCQVVQSSLRLKWL